MRILIIRNDHIGDMVYSTPIFRELKKSIPDCHITVLASPENKPIIEKNHYIDEIIELPIPKKSIKNVWQYLKMSWKIRRKKFDIGIDLRGSVQNSFFLLWLAGIKKKISHIEWHPFIKMFLDVPLQFDKSRYVFDDNAEMLQALGAEQKDKWPEIIFTPEDEDKVKDLMKTLKLKQNKFICILPCAGLPEKQWSLDKFVGILKGIRHKYKKKYKIVLMGLDKDFETLMKLSDSETVILRNMNVRHLPLLFKKSKLVLAHDGGPMHSAWLTGSKVIALYPAEFADKFLPLINCLTFQSTSRFNMDSITQEEVWKGIREVLG